MGHHPPLLSMKEGSQRKTQRVRKVQNGPPYLSGKNLRWTTRRRTWVKSTMFKENIINLPCWTIIKMPIYKEYLNHTLGLTLSTPGLVNSFYSDLGNIPCYSRRVVDHGCGLFEQMLCCSLPSVSLSLSLVICVTRQGLFLYGL